MGLFKRLTEVAKQVKDQIDESGLLDKARSVTSSRKAATAGAAEAVSADAGAAAPTDGATDWTSQQWPAALARGAVDPRPLLSVTEVAAISGRSIDRRSDHMDEEWFGSIFQSSDPDDHSVFELRVFHGHVDGGDRDPDAMWSYLSAEVPDVREVSGVGDAALRSGSESVFARVGDQVIYAIATVHDADGPPIAEELARQAADRI